MATIGVHRYARDTAAWREYLQHENRSIKELKDLSALHYGLGGSFLAEGKSHASTLAVTAKRPKTGTVKGSLTTFDPRHRTQRSQYYGDLKATKADGFRQTSYIKDDPMHHSDPPYVVIKPAY
jgi:hypothetical protein